MEQTEITFDNLPEAVAALTAEIKHIRKMLEEIQHPAASESIPIGINEACKLIMKAKSTVYSLVHRRQIPCYKSGQQLYFYKNELLDWIADGKQKSIAETKEEIQKQMGRSIRHKPSTRNF